MGGPVLICKQSDPQWRDEHKAVLGASLAAAVLGLDDKEEALGVFAQMKGLAPDKEVTEPMAWGTAFETAIGQRVAQEKDLLQEYGWADAVYSTDGGFYRSGEWPWLGATLDGRIGPASLPHEKRVQAEMKATTLGALWEDGVPLKVQVQAQQQIAVMESEETIVGVFTGMRNPPGWARIRRNEKLIRELLVPVTKEFMERVKKGEAPPLRHAGNAETQMAALRAIFPESDGRVVNLADELVAVAIAFEQAKAEEKAQKGEAQRLGNILREAIGKGAFGLLPNGWKYKYVEQSRAGYTVEATTSRPLVKVKN